MTTDASPGSAVVSEGGSVADEEPRPRSGVGRRALTLSYARPGRTGQGGGGCTPAVAEAEAKREVGANIEEVK